MRLGSGPLEGPSQILGRCPCPPTGVRTTSTPLPLDEIGLELLFQLGSETRYQREIVEQKRLPHVEPRPINDGCVHRYGLRQR